MADGSRLFHSNHGNVAASGAAPSVATVGAAVLAMRKQTGVSGRLIDVTPTAIVIPAALEAAVTQLFSGLYRPTVADEVNPFANLKIITDARLDAKSATRWYIVATAFDGLVAANLEGNAAPVLETRAGFEVDGVQLRVRHDFGTAVIEHRGWYSNAGA